MDVVRGSNRRRAAWSRNALMVVVSEGAQQQCSTIATASSPLDTQQQQNAPFVRLRLRTAHIWRDGGC